MKLAVEFSLEVVSEAQLFPMVSGAEMASGRHNIHKINQRGQGSAWG